MKLIDIGAAILETLARFSQNHSGNSPQIFVTLAPAMTQVPWENQSADEAVRRFVYEVLLTCNSDIPVEISLRRRSCLNDLNAFIGIKPSYWIQLRISSRGIRVGEKLIDELFDEMGFRIEEWLGVDCSAARLAIFGTIDAPTFKIVFCLESLRHKTKCDLLLPIYERPATTQVEASKMLHRSLPV